MTQDKVREITKKLEEGVQDVFNSQNYTDYLDCMAKFYNYSANNTILIWMQKPDATLVAGYQAWKKKFGRNVKKGEKAIKIIAPIPRKTIRTNDNGEEEEYVYNVYTTASVFDVSQTEGADLPNLDVSELTGTVVGYADLMANMRQIAGVNVEFDDIKPKGYYSPADDKIVLKSGMSEEQTLKTMIHETAHSILHRKGGEQESADRHTMEVQAESVAYTVCSYFGLDTSEYSFGYITGWSSGRECKELIASMDVIRKTAKEIIEKVEQREVA